METQIDNLLKRNQLSVTGSRKKILELFLASRGALAHGDIENYRILFYYLPQYLSNDEYQYAKGL